MRRIVEKVADLLMYSGPTMAELVKKAVSEGKEFEIEQNGGFSVLKVKSHLPYEIETTDKYFYNRDNQLIKQTICIRNKEKTVFDKYGEATEFLTKLERQNVLVS